MVNLRPQAHPNPYVRVRADLPWPPPTNGDSAQDEASRRIPTKVWMLDEIKQLVGQYTAGDENAITVITKDCASDMQKHGLEKADLAQFVSLLDENKYLNSAWCMASKRPGVKTSEEARWYPCDAYCLEVTRELDDATTLENKFYIKMCKTATGRMLLIASMHDSDY